MNRVKITTVFLIACLLGAPSLVTAQSSFVFDNQYVAEMDKDGRIYAEGGARMGKSNKGQRSRGGRGGKTRKAEGGA